MRNTNVAMRNTNVAKRSIPTVPSVPYHHFQAPNTNIAMRLKPKNFETNTNDAMHNTNFQPFSHVRIVAALQHISHLVLIKLHHLTMTIQQIISLLNTQWKTFFWLITP